MATILVVDDRAVNRELMKTVLGYRGHTVLEAQDGLEALELAKTHLPELIISDVLMPTMDGFEFARQLRQYPAICGTPLIFSSAHYPKAESRALAAVYGVHTILTKPCEPQVVLDAVDEMLGNPVPVDETVTPGEEFNYEHLRLVTDKLSRRNDELRAANLQVTKLIQLGQQMVQEKEPTHLIREYCDAAREIIGAECADLGLLNESEFSIKRYWACGLDAEFEVQAVSDSSEGLIDEIVRRRASHRLNDLPVENSILGFPPSFPSVSSFVGVPIASASRVYGWFCLSNKLGADQFSQNDQELLNLLAAQLGVSYENARLYTEAKRRANELQQEINERRRAEQALRKKEAQCESLIGSSIIGILVTDTEGRINQANDAFLAMVGYTREDLDAGTLRWDELTPPEYRNASALAVQQLVQDGVSSPFEKEYFRKDGSRVPVLVGVNLLAGSMKECVTFVLDITERKRAEAVRGYLASIVESSSDAIVGKTPNGIVTSWNNGAERIYGYTAEEVLGRHVSMLAQQDRVDEIHKILDQLKQGEAVRDLETLRLRKDGQVVNVSLSVSPIKDSAGSITGSSTIARDITERKQAENDKARLLVQVQDQKQRIDNIVTNVPGVVWEASGQPDEAFQRIDFVSDYVERMLGYSVEEWLATPNFWLSIVHTDDKEQAARDGAAIYASGGSGVSLFRWLTKDGRALWVAAHMMVVCDESGSPIGMRGVTLDITERKRAEDELRKQKEVLQRIFDQSPVMISFADENGHITLANREWERTLGWTREEIREQGVDLIAECYPDPDAHRKVVEFVNAATGEWADFKIRRRDGRMIDTSWASVRLSDGTSVGIGQDISERKRAEEAITKAHNSALETARVKAEFLSNMSHELRTPMNGIIGFTGLLGETDLTDEQTAYLDMVAKSADSMMVLINNILTFSESDPDKLDTSEFSLKEHIHESVMTFDSAAKNKGLSMSYQISPDVPATLVGDPERLSKILRLLVDNAVKFTERGHIVVSAAVESWSQHAIELLFTVQDTGIGIPDDRHDMIFNPFIQVDGSASRKYGGAGLGLAICKHLVEMMGDRLWVDSKPGIGSAFHFTARFKLSEQPN